jgi:hypothetical protein
MIEGAFSFGVANLFAYKNQQFTSKNIEIQTFDDIT